MPHHKSAKKRVRQDIKKTERNRVDATKAKTIVKKIRLALAEGKKEEATNLLGAAQSLLARLSKKGIIKANSAARKTGRLASAINKI